MLMIQSGHKFAHVTTAQLSWHVQNWDLIESLDFNTEHVFVFQELDYNLIINCKMGPWV